MKEGLKKRSGREERRMMRREKNKGIRERYREKEESIHEGGRRTEKE